MADGWESGQWDDTPATEPATRPAETQSRSADGWESGGGWAPVPAPGERSLIGDIGRGFASSAVGTLAAGVGGAEYLAGSGGTLTRWRESLSRTSDDLARGMSPQMQAALQREFIPGGEGESAWSSFGNFLGSVAAQAVATSGSMVSAVPAILGAALAGPYAIPAAAVIAAGTGAMLGGGTVWNDAAEAFGNLDEERRMRNPTYARLRGEGVDVASAINETVREAAAGAVEFAAVGSGAINAATGAFLGRLGSRTTGGVRRGFVEGLRTETPTEFLEEGLQTDQSQRVRERLTGEPYSLRETAEGAVRGAIAGGALGAGMGAVGGAVSRREEQPPPAPPPAEAPPTPTTPGVDPSVTAALAAGTPSATPGAAPSPTPAPAPSPMSSADPLGAQAWSQSPASQSAAAPTYGAPNLVPADVTAALAQSGVLENIANTPITSVERFAGEAAPQVDPQAGVLAGLAEQGVLENISSTPPNTAGILAEEGRGTDINPGRLDVARLAAQGNRGPARGPMGAVESLAAQGRNSDGPMRAERADSVLPLADQGRGVSPMRAPDPLTALAREGREANRWNPRAQEPLSPAAATGPDSAVEEGVGASTPPGETGAAADALALHSASSPQTAEAAPESTPQPEVKQGADEKRAAAPEAKDEKPNVEARTEAAAAPRRELKRRTDGDMAKTRTEGEGAFGATPKGVQTAKAVRERVEAKKGISSKATVVPKEEAKPTPKPVESKKEDLPPRVAEAKKRVRGEALARARSVMEKALGEKAYEQAGNDTSALVDAILDQAASEVQNRDLTPAVMEGVLQRLVMPRLGKALKTRIDEIRAQEQAEAEAQEKADASKRITSDAAPEIDAKDMRIGKRDVAAALDGNVAAIRKVLTKFSVVAQDNLAAWYRRNFAAMVEERGKGEPDWLTGLREIAESAKRGGDAESRAARTKAVEELRQRFTEHAATNDNSASGRRAEVERIFDEGAATNPAKEAPRERMQRYRRLRQEIAQAIGAGGLDKQLGRIGDPDSRAAAIIRFLARAGRGTDANFDADTSTSFVLPELMIRAGQHAEAMREMQTEAEIQSGGRGTGGETDSETEGNREEASDVPQIDDLEMSSAEIVAASKRARGIINEANLRTLTPAQQAQVTEDTNEATDADLAAYRAQRTAQTQVTATQHLVERAKTGNTLKLGGPRAAGIGANISDEKLAMLSLTKRLGYLYMDNTSMEARALANAPENSLTRTVWNILSQKTADTAIHIMSDEAWEKYAGEGAMGYFVPNPIDAVKAGAAPGYVMVPRSLIANNDTTLFREIVLHEMTHAATYATVLMKNSRARAKLVKLMEITRQQLEKHDVHPDMIQRMSYALTNPEEFIAVAMSNENVQRALSVLEVTPEQRKSLGLIGVIRNVFQAFVQWVRGEVLSLPPGFYSVMEAVIEIADTSMQNPATQRAQIATMVNPQLADTNAKALTGIFDAIRNVGTPLSADAIGRSATDSGQFFKKLGLGFSTMRQLEMIGRNLFKRDERTNLLHPTNNDNPIEIASKAQNERAVKARDRLQNFLKPLKAMQALPAESQEKVSNLLVDATLAEAHPDADISKGGPNEHLIGKGARQTQGRARHAGLKSRYDAMNAAEKKAYHETINALRQAHTTAVDSIINYQIDLWYTQQAEAYIRDPVKYPAPPSASELEALKGRARANTLTDPDKALLGDDVFESLNTAHNRKKMKGPYVPLQRFGDYVVAWKENAPETVTFPDEAAAEAHIESSEYAALKMRKHYFDASGNEITEPAPDILANEEGVALTKLGPSPTPKERATELRAAKRRALEKTRDRDTARSEVRVTQQVNGLAMFESLAEAKAFREEQRAAGKTTAEVRVRDNPAARASALQDADFERMKSAIEKDDTLPQDFKNQAVDALASAYVAIIPNRTLQASLIKRRKVLGATKDVKRVIANYGIAVSNFSAGMDTALPVTMALKSMREQTREASRNPDVDTGASVSRGNMIAEMEKRLLSSPSDVAGGGSTIPWVRKIQSLAYIFYLASPSYSVIQATQPWMLGLPVLASRSSMPAAAKALGKAMQDVGLGSITKGGLKDAVNALKHFTGGQERDPQPILQDLKTRLARKPDGAALVKMLEALEKEGLVDGEAGLELVRAELTRDGFFGTKLGQAEALARAFPAAIEVVNRTSTAIAAYRLAVAQGKTPEQATSWAREAVDQSQADYSSSNTARFMDPRRYPWIAPMMTFRKYAQAVYFLMIRNAYLSFKGASPEERKQARRTLGFTLGTHAMMAGALGLPTEAINLALGAVSMLFGSDEPWDWEKEVRQALAQAFGPEVGEIIARGLPRAAGVDLHGRMGLNSLMFINDLRDFEQRSLTEYAGQFLMGAPGAMLTGMLAAPGQIADGNGMRAVEAAVPKGLRDILKAARFDREGVTTRRGERIDGRQPGEDGMGTGEMLIQALGFTPSRIAETYERRNAVQGANRRLTEDRNNLMREYRQAQPADRGEVWQRIMEFNRELPSDVRGARITRDALIRSVRESARRARSSGGEDYLPRGREGLRREGEFANTGR